MTQSQREIVSELQVLITRLIRSYLKIRKVFLYFFWIVAQMFFEVHESPMIVFAVKCSDGKTFLEVKTKSQIINRVET
jgi:hypothetical protein